MNEDKQPAVTGGENVGRLSIGRVKGFLYPSAHRMEACILLRNVLFSHFAYEKIRYRVKKCAAILN